MQRASDDTIQYGRLIAALARVTRSVDVTTIRGACTRVADQLDEPLAPRQVHTQVVGQLKDRYALRGMRLDYLRFSVLVRREADRLAERTHQSEA